MIHFTDPNTGIAVASSALPESFQFECHFRPERTSVLQFYSYYGKAVSQDGRIQIFFQSGDRFVFPKISTPLAPASFTPGERTENGAMMAWPCPVSDQLQSFAQSILQADVQPSGRYTFSEEKKMRLQAENQRNLAFLQEQLSRMMADQNYLMNIQIQNILEDGEIDVYRTVGNQSVFAIAAWRFGSELAYYQNQMSPFYMPSSFQTVNYAANGSGFGFADTNGAYASVASWEIPVVIWMQCDEAIYQEGMNVFAEFVSHFQISEQLQQADLQNALQVEQEQRQMTQMNNAVWAQKLQEQNASWDRVQQFGRSMSADLDAFRASTWDTIHQNDAFRQNMSDTSSFSQNESYDERIQRMRHEAMMDVNTYEREDGTTTEFSTQADRVFEQNLDQRNQFGTENYYDDYVPDGWSELQRKK